MIGPLRRWLAGRTSTQLASALAVLAALALTGSLVLTGQAVSMDQRQQAALSALDDYAAMVSKLGCETDFNPTELTEIGRAHV